MKGRIACFFLANLSSLYGVLVLHLSVFSQVLCLLPLFILTLLPKIRPYSLWFLAGFIWTSFYFMYCLPSKWPIDWQAKQLTITGKVDSIPVKNSRRTQFMFSVTEVDDRPFTTRVLLSDYRSRRNYRVGSVWLLTVKLKKPRGFLNPASPRSRLNSLVNRVAARGYIVNSASNRLISPGVAWSVDSFRAFIQRQLQDNTSAANLALIEALSIGFKGDISSSMWGLLRATGTSHLMAISGLHIGLVAGISLYLMMFLWRRSAFLCQLLAAQRAASIAGIVMAFSYALLAGFTLPTQRALIMITTALMATVFRQRGERWHGLSLALLLVLCCDPLSPLTAGFYLSFFAVVALFYILHSSTNSGWLVSYIKMQAVILVALMPLTLFWFKQVSVLSMPANLIAIPWVGFVVVPLSLLSLLSLAVSSDLAGMLLSLTEYALAVLVQLLQIIANAAWLNWHTGIDNIVIAALMLLGSLVLLAPRAWPRKWLGLLAFIPLLLPQTVKPPSGELFFFLLDVGQGLASVIMTEHHVLVYDAGPKYYSGLDLGQIVVVPFLRTLSLSSIDMLIISHDDIDHRGGAEAIIAAVAVEKLYASKPERFKQAYSCENDTHWRWDGVDFQLLKSTDAAIEGDNDNSCVLLIDNGHQRILLPGDIEAAGEQALMERLPSVDISLLVAPHHGSRSSSSLAFIRHFKPKIVLFSAGYLNRYRFPHQLVVDRYTNNHSQLTSTAECGMIQWRMRKQNTIDQPSCYFVPDPSDLRP